MVNLMRKHQQTLMLVVTIIVIIAFIWLYNDTRRYDRSGADRVGTIYGRGVTMAQYSREARKFDVCRGLGLVELWSTLIGNEARDEAQATEAFVWNTMVLRHEADGLGIQPTDDDVFAAVQLLPAFQTNGVYDSSKFVNFTQNMLNARGLTEEQILELVRDDIRLSKMKALVGSTVAAAPSEVRSMFERRSQKTELSFVRLMTEDVAKEVKVTDDEVKKLFEERKETLKSDEMRKVKVAGFTMETVEKPLAGKERATAMSKLGDKAQEFAIAMTEAGAKLDEVAKKFGVEVKETADFSMDDPPKELGQSEEAAQAIFQKLTPEQPNSDVVMSQNGYYVFQLAGVTPARPLTFDEAKAKLEAQLKAEHTQESMALKAAAVRTKIDAELKAGKSFADAATAAGVKAETLPAFSMMEPPKAEMPDSRLIMSRAFDLAEGQLSEPIAGNGDTLLVRVEKRLPVDEKKFEEEKGMIAENVARGKRESAFELWLKDRRNQAKIVGARG